MSDVWSTQVRSASAPAVRAKHLQLWLDTAERTLAPAEATAFLGRIPQSCREEVARLAGTTWLPMELDVAFADELLASLGSATAHQFYVDFTLATFGGSIVGPLVQGAIRLSGATPAVAIKWWPRGWEGLFRHAGKLTGELVSDAHARLTYDDLPRACVQSSPWVDSLRSALHGILVLCKAGGDVTIRPESALRRVHCDLTWTS